LEYDAALVRTLFDGETRVRDVQMVRSNYDGGQPEEAVYFVNVNEGDAFAAPRHVLVSVRAVQNVAIAILQDSTVVVARDVAQIAIDEEVFRRTRGVWREMIRAARFPSATSALSGTDYYFTADLGGSFGTAFTPGPMPGTASRKLATIGEALAAYARAEMSSRPQLRRQLLDLVLRLEIRHCSSCLAGTVPAAALARRLR
jgi:hypothetical protein